MDKRYFSTVLFVVSLLLTACGGEATQSAQSVATTSAPTMVKTEPAIATPIPQSSQTLTPKPTSTPAVDYLQQGITNFKAGNGEQAIRDFSQAIQLQPDNPEAYFNRGKVYAAGYAIKLAIADISTAIELKPDYVEAYFYRGFVHVVTGNPKQGIVDFSKVIELQPDYAEAYAFRGKAYAGSGDPEQAIRDFEQYLELAPGAPNRAEVEKGIEELKTQLNP